MVQHFFYSHEKTLKPWSFFILIPMKITILSGAGMSAESGLSTFRDNGGLWDKYNVYEVATPEAWAKDKALVLDFYNQRRKQLNEVKSNLGHLEIAKWQDLFDVQIITQNIDDLHERAGSENVLHLHGELKKSRSTGPGQEVYPIYGDFLNVEDKCPEGYALRPHVVWFGEEIPAMTEAAQLMADTNVLVVVGTSLNVYPAASLAHITPPCTSVYVIDPKPLEQLPAEAIHIQEKAVSGLQKLTSIFLQTT